MRNPILGSKLDTNLNKVGLIFLVARSDQPVDFASKPNLVTLNGELQKQRMTVAHFLVVVIRNVPFREASFSLSVLYSQLASTHS